MEEEEGREAGRAIEDGSETEQEGHRRQAQGHRHECENYRKTTTRRTRKRKMEEKGYQNEGKLKK